MEDNDSRTLLKGSLAAFGIAAAAKIAERSLRKQTRQNVEPPDDKSITLPNGRTMIDPKPWPAVPKPGPRGRFMNPRIPGPGYVPNWRQLWREEGLSPRDIIAQREREWYERRGYIREGNSWVKRTVGAGSGLEEISWWRRLFSWR